MVIVIYTVLWPACSFILCIFGFFVGRCARKIPILDSNLPRALHRGELPPKDSTAIREQTAGDTRCPADDLRIGRHDTFLPSATRIRADRTLLTAIKEKAAVPGSSHRNLRGI